MHFFFVRHGETNYNVDKLLNDDPKQNVYLTPRGIEQSRTLADKLKDKKIEIIVVSELKRTAETATIINTSHHAPIRVDSRINDRKTGFEGKHVVEFYRAIETDIFNKKINGGESFQEEKIRIHSFLNEIKNMPQSSTLVVTHAEPLKIIAGYFNGLSDSELFAKRFENAEVFEVSI